MTLVGVEFRFLHATTGYIVATGAEFAELRAALGKEFPVAQVDELLTMPLAQVFSVLTVADLVDIAAAAE